MRRFGVPDMYVPVMCTRKTWEAFERRGARLPKDAFTYLTFVAEGLPKSEVFGLLDETEGKTYRDYLNPTSLTVLPDALVEPSLAAADTGMRYQFLRHGYFCKDPDSTPERPVYNRTVSLKDSWAREQHKTAQ
mgnify:CR=1 FL=1